MGSGYTLVPKEASKAEEYFVTDAGGFGFKYELGELENLDAMTLFNLQDIRRIKPQKP